MPPHTRSQRRRQGTRQQQRQQRPVIQPVQVPNIDDVEHDTLAVEATNPGSTTSDVVMPDTAAATVASQPRSASTRTTRRMRSRAEPEPVDYSKDY